MVIVYRLYPGQNFQFLIDIPRLQNTLSISVVDGQYHRHFPFRSMFKIEFSCSDIYVYNITSYHDIIVNRLINYCSNNAKHANTCGHQIYLAGVHGGNYLIIQSLGTAKQGRKSEFTRSRIAEVFLTLRYTGKLLGPEFLAGLDKNPKYTISRSRQIILYNEDMNLEMTIKKLGSVYKLRGQSGDRKRTYF